jgi:hypothetical protein
VGVVAVAVVEHHVGLVGLRGQLLDVARPRRQLAGVVAVAEPLLDVVALPLVRVPVQADHGEVAGGGQHRRDGVRVALRLVHAHVRQPVRGQEPERLLLVVVGHPGVVAELDADPPRRGPLGAGEDVVLVRARDREPGRELEQDRAELARLAQRLERRQEPAPRLGRHLRVDVLEVDAFLARLARGLPQVGGQHPHRGGVLGEQAEGLDVEGEPVRGPRRPRLRGPLGGQRVVGGVHLHQRELAGVVLQPLLRIAGPGRVPAGIDQRLVGPPRRAHPDLSHNPQFCPVTRGLDIRGRTNHRPGLRPPPTASTGRRYQVVSVLCATESLTSVFSG